MQRIKKYLALALDTPPKGASTLSFPIRRKGKQTRLFIDNEYFTLGYSRALPLSTLSVYLVLAKYANAKTQSCYPSVGTIQKEAGITRNTCYKAIKILEKYKIVWVSHSKGHSSNKYLLLDTSVWVPLSKPADMPVPNIEQEPSQKVNSTPPIFGTQSHIKKSDNEITQIKEEKTGGEIVSGILVTLKPYFEDSDILKAATVLYKKDKYSAVDVKNLLKQLASEGKITPIKKINW